ncbi:MAG: glyoxalase [Chloroflexi bacterium]|nr:MAG: glyoxalase [Chloroflexota bacterium]
MLKVRGIHHITAICRDMERTTAFYTRVLGMRLVKQTVNYDDPNTKHFYFGDEQGRPGTVITFFEYPEAVAGRVGAGSTHHIAFMVEDEEEQDRFKAHLEAQGIHVNGPFDRTYFRSIYFRDPDGHILEIATRGPGFAVDEPEDELGTHMILPGTTKTRDLSRYDLDSDERV